MDEKDNIEYKIGIAGRISEKITQGDYITALFAIEQLPEDYKKDSLYSGVALSLQKKLCSPERDEQKKNPLMEQLINYCKNQSKYFK